MKNSVTQEDLIRYLYNETSDSEKLHIAKTLETDWDVRERYEDIKTMQNVFNRIPLRSPSKTSIKLIMDYCSQIETLEPHT